MEPSIWNLKIKKMLSLHIGTFPKISFKSLTPGLYKSNQGRHHVSFFGGSYVNLGPFILDNIRTLVKALQKQSSWKLVA